MEFYKEVFYKGNKELKTNALQNPDNEIISYVPEVGNIWSGLIALVFDRSNFMSTSIFSDDVIRKMITHINSIYQHYKSVAQTDNLTRHIVMELVNEINRRYGIVKRQELSDYYKAMSLAKKGIRTEESRGDFIDLDILDESNDYESSAPSDAYIKLKESTSLSNEEKLSTLTDYKIIKEFKGKINAVLEDASRNLFRDGHSLTNKIRNYKKMVSNPSVSASDKYKIIFEAIQKSTELVDTNVDITLAFHEFVIAPLETLTHIYSTLLTFIRIYYHCATVKSEADYTFNGKLGSYTLAPVGGAGPTPDSSVGDHVQYPNALLTYGSNEARYIGLLNQLATLSANLNGFVTTSFGTAHKTISLDFSGLRQYCDRSMNLVKYALPKFYGMIDDKQIKKVEDTNVFGSLYNLQARFNVIFNKYNEHEFDDFGKRFGGEQGIILDIVTENINTTMSGINLTVADVVNNIIFAAPPRDRTDALYKPTECLPVVRDLFTTMNHNAVLVPLYNAHLSNLIMDAREGSLHKDMSTDKGRIVQVFNRLILDYVNQLYDSQSKKIYGRCFETFASETFASALEGNCIFDILGQKDLSNQPIDGVNQIINVALRDVWIALNFGEQLARDIRTALAAAGVAAGADAQTTANAIKNAIDGVAFANPQNQNHRWIQDIIYRTQKAAKVPGADAVSVRAAIQSYTIKDGVNDQGFAIDAAAAGAIIAMGNNDPTKAFRDRLVQLEPYMDSMIGVEGLSNLLRDAIKTINDVIAGRAGAIPKANASVGALKPRLNLLQQNIETVTIDFTKAQTRPESGYQYATDPSTFRTEFLTGNIPIPRERLPLSAINAVILRNLSNRVTRHQMKFHLFNTINEVSVLAQEKYRAKLPAFIRLFENLLRRSMLYRQIISKYLDPADTLAVAAPSNAVKINVQPYRYVQGDHGQPHMVIYDMNDQAYDIKHEDNVRILDNVIEGCRALINDAKSVMSELDTLDNASPIFFDTKKSFSKNAYETTQRLPCMPFSVLNVLYNQDVKQNYQLLPSGSPTIDGTNTSKFLYGSRLILTEKDELPLSQFKYVKQVADLLNGYIHTTNGFDDTKLEEFIKVNTKLIRYMADVHYYNNAYITPGYEFNADPDANPVACHTFEAKEGLTPTISIVESTNPLESKRKISESIHALLSSATPSQKYAIVANLSDLNVVPINMHALMREIPLIHIYNYAFVFEEIVQSKEEYGLDNKYNKVE